MNTLRLENINLHSSYMVGQTEENPFSFYFDTDFGLRYTISFMLENLTWQNPGPLGSAACPSKNFL